MEKDSAKRFNTFYQNGIHGFQPLPLFEDHIDNFVVCFLNKTPTGSYSFQIGDLDKIREVSGLKTVKDGDYIGRDYLEIHTSEVHLIPQLLTSLLKMRYYFQTCTKGLPGFGKDDSVVFTHELLEETVIKQIKGVLTFDGIYLIDDAFAEPWNYITKEGKEFAIEVRKKLGHRYDSERANYFEWDIFHDINFELMTTNAIYHKEKIECIIVIEDETGTLKKDVLIQEIKEPQINSVIIKDEPIICVVCCDKEADTMVLPCEHNVVCKSCSLILETTQNAHICVVCRCKITHKLQ